MSQRQALAGCYGVRRKSWCRTSCPFISISLRGFFGRSSRFLGENSRSRDEFALAFVQAQASIIPTSPGTWPDEKLALLCPSIHASSSARISRPLRHGAIEDVDTVDQLTPIFSLNSACAAYSSISLQPTLTDSSPPSRPWFRLCMRHTLPQALSRVRSISPLVRF
jgi:hypothetical protein